MLAYSFTKAGELRMRQRAWPGLVGFRVWGLGYRVHRFIHRVRGACKGVYRGHMGAFRV